MRTFLYKSAMFILSVVILVAMVATAFELMVGNTSLAIMFGIGAVVIGILMLTMSHKRHTGQARSIGEPNQSESVHYLAERPVMTYKGKVYDFVHNDPTAPDAA